MINPRQLKIKDFDYPLPDERIAKYPLAERDQSKLLTRKTERDHSAKTYSSICPNYLPAGALMVFNNTKVIQRACIFTSRPAH